MRFGVVIGLGCILGVGLACASLGEATPGSSQSETREAMTVRNAAATGGVELKPPVGGPLLVHVPTYHIPELADGELGLYAYYYATHVYLRPDRKPRTLGLVRRGTLLRAAKAVTGPGCSHGTWYELADKGYACAGRGFTLTPGELTQLRQLRPNVRRSLPFQYGKVNSREALRYYRIPTDEEVGVIKQALKEHEKLPDVVADQLDGDYFVAIDRKESEGERHYYRTVLGRYVRVADVELRSEPTMQGELLQGDMQLPLAFVYGEPQVPVLKEHDGKIVVVGKAYKHARFPVVGEGSWGDKDVVVSPAGYGIDRKHVRVIRRHERPSGVDKDEKWIHVDLDRQALVAYRGDRPVFATLVSTGREGHDTPEGFYRIHEKHKTTTMRGDDPKDGPFEVSEVPWTMFYRGSYALHGAYWHNDFGNVRSHGCTNLSPIDARWLFHFTDGLLPSGWHALRQLEGTAVYMTREG